MSLWDLPWIIRMLYEDVLKSNGLAPSSGKPLSEPMMIQGRYFDFKKNKGVMQRRFDVRSFQILKMLYSTFLEYLTRMIQRQSIWGSFIR